MCDQSWDFKDANVVCRMLGFDGALQVYAGGQFGEGTGAIHYGGLECNGGESRILHCRNTGTESCTHANDAGVRCKIMRLADGQNRNYGRVEVFMNDTWGTMCDGFLTFYDVYRMAGELSRSAYQTVGRSPAKYGAGTGDIKIKDMSCSSSTGSSILDCKYSTNTSQCTHSDDISMSTNSGARVFATDKHYQGNNKHECCLY